MDRNSDLQGKKQILYFNSIYWYSYKNCYCCSSAFLLQGSVKLYQKNNSSGNLFKMKKHYHHTDFTFVCSHLLLNKFSKVVSNGHQQLQLQSLHSFICHFFTSMAFTCSSTKVQSKHFDIIFDHQSVLKADNHDRQYHRERQIKFLL